jgi:CubicO group peptidase (beta-lactamase class C family)
MESISATIHNDTIELPLSDPLLPKLVAIMKDRLIVRFVYLGFLVALLITLTGVAAPSDSPPMGGDPSEEIDHLVQRCLSEDGTPSASVAVVRDGQIVYAKAFGKASLEPPSPANAGTRYQLASLSKTFTAQAILLLAAEDRLSLSDTVSRWYPDLTGANKITVRQLLSHTSGFPDHYPQTYPAGPRTKATQPDAIIDEWGHHPLLFVPGTEFRYSNLNYLIAGRIVEKVSGKPLFEFMSDRIFQPLGMSGTLDLDKLPPDSRSLSTGYVRVALAPLRPAPYEGPGWSFGSGQVVSTAKDVALWDVAFLQHRILPEPEATEEVTPAKMANGHNAPAALGLFVSEADGVRRYYHTGQGLGFLAANFIYPEAKFAVVVLCNSSAAATHLKVAFQLAYLLLPLSRTDALARRVFSCLQNGRMDELFSEDLKKHMSGAILDDYRSSLAPLGSVQSFDADPPNTTDGLQTRVYSVSAGGHRLKLHLLFLTSGLIEDVQITDAGQ